MKKISLLVWPVENLLKLLKQKGSLASAGYGKMNKSSYVTGLARNRHFLDIYGEKTMKEWLERNQCPENDKLTEQAVWFFRICCLYTNRYGTDC